MFLAPDISLVQGLYIVSNVAAGNEVHKEAVMDIVIPVTSVGVNRNTSLLMRYLQDMSNPQIRVVALWCVINLTFPNSPGVSSRISRLRDGGIEAQLQSMVDDPCLDVKVRTKL